MLNDDRHHTVLVRAPLEVRGELSRSRLGAGVGRYCGNQEQSDSQSSSPPIGTRRGVKRTRFASVSYLWSIGAPHRSFSGDGFNAPDSRFQVAIARPIINLPKCIPDNDLNVAAPWFEATVCPNYQGQCPRLVRNMLETKVGHGENRIWDKLARSSPDEILQIVGSG